MSEQTDKPNFVSLWIGMMVIYLVPMLPSGSSCLPNLALHQAGVYQPDCCQSVGRELLPHDFNLTVPSSGLRRCIFCCTCPKLDNRIKGLRTFTLLFILGSR